MSGSKKRSFDTMQGGTHTHTANQFTVNTPTMTSVVPVRGTAFRGQLRDLTARTRDEVIMSTTLPLRYSTTSTQNPDNLNKSTTRTLNTSYTRATHASTVNQTTWTQGYMNPAGDTKWRKILPKHLSLDMATKTNRVVKSIMGHDVKDLDFPGVTKIAEARKASKRTSTPATLSFVEDVTGELAASTRHTGSAVRAGYLGAKLWMKNNDATEFRHFKAKMMYDVSQLHGGGAVQLAQKISSERTASHDGQTSASATNYATSIANVHNFLDNQITQRFTAKHTKYQTIKNNPAKVRSKLGDWWADADRSNAGTAQASYFQNKRSKHGIL